MYEQGEFDFDKLAQSAQEYVLKNDRRAFLPILRAIERFAVTRKMIIGGRVGIHTICEIPIEGVDVNLWILELYSLDIERDMNDCIGAITTELQNAHESSRVDEIYQGDYRTIILRPSVPEREYQIWADFRLVAIGYSLGERQGIDITGIIAPISRTGPFGTEGSLLMPSDVQIMRVTSALSNPMFAGDWAIYLRQLCNLFQHTLTHDGHREGAGADDGGAEETEAKTKVPFSLKQGVLIGEYAVAYYLGEGERTTKYARPQFICSFDGVDEFAEDEHFTTRYSDLRVPNDFRARKIILRDARGEIVADLFNALAYEPIPVNTIKRRIPHIETTMIASPFVVLRFLFVDIWALSFVMKKSASEKPLRQRQHFLRGLARKLLTWILESKVELDMLFPVKYVGLYIPEAVAKRQEAYRKHIHAETTSAVSKKDLIALGNDILKRMSVV